MENNEFLLKSIVRYNALNSPNSFVPPTIPQRFYSEDYWFSKYGHSQPCHRGFTVKTNDFPNMGTVNHATENYHTAEDLQ